MAVDGAGAGGSGARHGQHGGDAMSLASPPSSSSSALLQHGLLMQRPPAYVPGARGAHAGGHSGARAGLPPLPPDHAHAHAPWGGHPLSPPLQHGHALLIGRPRGASPGATQRSDSFMEVRWEVGGVRWEE